MASLKLRHNPIDWSVTVYATLLYELALQNAIAKSKKLDSARRICRYRPIPAPGEGEDHARSSTRITARPAAPGSQGVTDLALSFRRGRRNLWEVGRHYVICYCPEIGLLIRALLELLSPSKPTANRILVWMTIL